MTRLTLRADPDADGPNGQVQSLYAVAMGTESFVGFDRPAVPDTAPCSTGTSFGYPCFRTKDATSSATTPIVVLITDFYEGRAEHELVDQTRLMAEGGIRMIGLGALGYDARPNYNKDTAGKLRKQGMDILVCTPEKLAECMAQIIRG